MSHDYEIRLEEICTRRKHGFEYFSPYFAILEKNCYEGLHLTGIYLLKVNRRNTRLR